MISPFEEMASADEAAVLPMEFVSLDAPNEPQQSSPGMDAPWRERVDALESRLVSEAEANRLRVDEARRSAEQETRDRLTEDCERRVQRERELVANLADEFVRQRADYFADVEREVVSLALAIAGRVLEREAAIDALLLRAVVRIALDKVAGESGVSLHVPMKDTAVWREVLAEERHAAAVTVIGDEKMHAGEAVLETRVGRVEMGIREQLKEIERGFLDLIEKRPS
jgi:flagellar assembly protein FliH